MTTLALLDERPTQVDTDPAIAPYRRFRPSLGLGHQQELQELARRVASLSAATVQAEIAEALCTAEEHSALLRHVGLTSADVLPTLRYSAALLVLRDLLLQGWKLREDDEGILLDAPGRASLRVTDPEEKKEELRRSFAFARDAQLRQAATVRFINSMERRGVRLLFADGAELADRLTAHGLNAVAPELELVQPGQRDPGTGLLLQDIWRYARHFWSIPYQSTPGRNMFYLVRDAAVPARPLIGIAALGNPVLGLSQRDDYYGWSARWLRRSLTRLSEKERRALAAHLFSELEDGISSTFREDFWPDRSSPSDWRDAQRLLLEAERDSAADRLEQLDEAGDMRTPEYRLIRSAQTAVEEGDHGLVDWERIATTSLYTRKRAGTLADLLFAHGFLAELGFSRAGGPLEEAFRYDDGIRALEIALRRMKQRVIASSVMELITCGAVPPYREILGGKLVATLMLSREVVSDFSNRYTGRVSLIASALAGRPVTRPAHLALITTSSLYAVGSSQYNRIRVPLGGGALAYRRIGTTDSFGTVHFAPDTVNRLSAVARQTDANRITNLFGEGTSPKLRLVRSGLEALGLNPEVFLRHHSPRLLYGAALCSNIDEVLLGSSHAPDYLVPPGPEGMVSLVEHWRERWLAQRADRPDVLERLRAQRFEAYCLGGETTRLQKQSPPRRAELVGGASAPPAPPSRQQQDSSTFIERLYRSSKSYADRLTQEELDHIHVDLGVDEYLLEQAGQGKTVVVTGNPGDGKTHLIERLRPRLEALGTRVITDANACSNEEILDTWQTCSRNECGFVLAINEWPLFVLARLARQRRLAAVDEALRQVTAARFFVPAQEPEPPRENVAVIDLSLRQILAPTVVTLVISRLTHPRFFEALSPADPARANREALSHPQVQERLAKLLSFVAGRIDHVTMRQLVGFVAFLLTGGSSAAERLRAAQDAVGFSYSNLAFAGGLGPLLDGVRGAFDPAAITHPEWDERLWQGQGTQGDWLWHAPLGPLSLPETEREAAFRAIKRRFFFEHARGQELMALVPRDEIEFEQVLKSGDDGGTHAGLVRRLILALNRFYEPDCSDSERDRLVLWQSHRYDVRPPSTFVALHDVPYQQFRIEPARLAPWVRRWLPTDQHDRRSFALVASVGGRDIALLEVDRDLFLTLMDAQRGLGRVTWSRSATRRITRFVDAVQRGVETASEVEDVRIRNVDSDLDERFAIQRTPPRYQL